MREQILKYKYSTSIRQSSKIGSSNGSAIKVEQATLNQALGWTVGQGDEISIGEDVSIGNAFLLSLIQGESLCERDVG